jgi:hypothetical protein
MHACMRVWHYTMILTADKAKGRCMSYTAELMMCLYTCVYVQYDCEHCSTSDGDKSYKDSKLCNVMFTRELNKRLQEAGSKVCS